METMAERFLEEYDHLVEVDLMNMAFEACVEYSKSEASVCTIKTFWFDDLSKLVCSNAGGCWHFEAQ